jgi:hypothetical protein
MYRSFLRPRLADLSSSDGFVEEGQLFRSVNHILSTVRAADETAQDEFDHVEGGSISAIAG